jgi:putative oxidoreductase
MKLGRLAARLFIGGLFVGHGTQKLFGWFGGPGPEGTAETMEKLEMRPARADALLAGASEAGGGAMFAAGFLTPLAGTALIATMITAIRKVHLQRGFWNTQGGYEFNLTLIAAILAMIDGGPGPISIDRALGIDDTGHGWALAALAAGAAGSTVAIQAAKRLAAERQEMEQQEIDFAAAERREAAARGTRFEEQDVAERVVEAALSSA